MLRYIEALLFPRKKINYNRLTAALQNKTVLITGASFGIGEALVRILSNTGAHLILAARTYEKLEVLQQELSAHKIKITILQADLRQETEVAKILQILLKLPGGIDVVVNNAGKSICRSIYASLDRFHDFTRTIHLNYLAPVQLLLGLIPALTQRKGQIINISATNVLLLPAPHWAAYQASKSAFDQWFRCALPELHAAGVATTSIYLPLVRTRMIEPTVFYNKMPAMKPTHAAAIIARAMYTRRRIFKPWWLFFATVPSALGRRIWERGLPFFLKKKNK
ncbi:MAG: SDR family NAD(P)-dependent oxidoreductase [Chitinophagaceae bacterium]|nr:SDR family NAD(P)-dependent oxidoreductase [Chitinophagaceae bacterium]